MQFVGTEGNNPRTRDLDLKDVSEILLLILDEERKALEAVEKSLPQIARVVNEMSRVLRNGGRVRYIGAGTSGRLGVLDAAELPPTFGVPDDQVKAYIAGGSKAMGSAVEEAEDSKELGAQAIASDFLSPADMVIGLTVSGSTPYVLGGIEVAKTRKAATVGICCNANTPLERLVDFPIVINTGPEVLMGSTRMKSTTAQKVTLNMVSTCVMIQLGKVYDNYLVDMRVSNSKLRKRAVNTLGMITDAPPSVIQGALDDANYHIKTALVMIKNDLSVEEARGYLEDRKGVGIR